MNKIMLIFISVVMLFTACGNQTDNSIEESVQTQIDPAEEFGGITFGMTQEEVIEFLERKPDVIYESDDEDVESKYIEYWYEEHFNVSNAFVSYSFKKDNDILYFVDYVYNYDESEQEQFMNDYGIIKKEILRRYPKEIWIDNYNDENDIYSTMDIYTENRSISLGIYPKLLIILVTIEEYNPIEDDPQT